MAYNRLSAFFKKLDSTSKLFLLIALIASCFSPASASNLPTSGSISGTAMYYGNLAAGLTLYVCYHVDLSGPPVECASILSPGGSYIMGDIDPGSYYISANIDANGGGGPPDPGEAFGIYDANGDGEPDQVIVGSGSIDGIDLAVNLSSISESTSTPIVYYVDDSATGANDGTSWADAFTSLQSALTAAAIAGTEIWVAAGTYKPGSTRDSTFQLKNNIAIYGGFAGTEILRHQRIKQGNETVLSGDVGAIGTWSDNTYHVVTGSSRNSTAVVSDVTIIDGYAHAGLATPGDRGGGMIILNGSPTISNVRFLHNYALNYGGAIAIYTNTTGIPSTYVSNCTFSGNYTPNNGGAIAVFSGGRLQIANSSFSGNTSNTASNAGGIVALGNTTFVYPNNLILAGNTPALYQIRALDNGTINLESSIVTGGCPATATVSCTDVIDADPLFVDANGADNIFGTLDDDFHLLWLSQAIDAGDNFDVFTDDAELDGDGDLAEIIPLDMDLGSRFEEFPGIDTGDGSPPIVDMGAYEVVPLKIFLPVIRK